MQKQRHKPPYDAIRANKKSTFQQSSITNLRYREPVNPKMSDRAMQFVVDYKITKRLIPDSNPSVLVESTQRGGGYISANASKNLMSVNRYGRSAALGDLYNANLGGCPDEPGDF